MPTTKLTSRELNQDIGRAKKAARRGPVIITDRGRPAHVLMTYEAYQKLISSPKNLVKSLSRPGLSEIPFDPQLSTISFRTADLS